MARIYGERWKTVEQLGEGGQAHAFLVTDVREDGESFYVLKRLKNLDRIERFQNEVEAIQRLSHENIVTLVDFDLEADRPYLVTEYCSGGSLAKAEPFWQGFPIIALEIFEQICLGIAYAHSQEPPIIHRDLKPDNIFLRSAEGPAVVGDFGICYLEPDGTRITLTEEVVGPRSFIAPELEDGRVDAVSPKSDTYSLGKVLYWLLSGGRIFSREKYRDEDWDLKGSARWSGRGPSETFWDNIYMEHINRLLDLMIVADPRQRYDVYMILPIVEMVKRAVEKEFNPIGKGIQQPCTYCGYGKYKLRAVDSQVTDFGLKMVGNPEWRILVCDVCGHVQFFRIQGVHRKEWWEGSSRK
jgi:serine/threonine protein kinase